MNYEKIWIEVFGIPRGKKIEDAEPSEMLRIPNHMFIKIEVEIE